MNEPKKVRVRIAVAVEADGTWSASGWSSRGNRALEEHERTMMDVAVDGLGEDSGESRWFVEADVPLPLPPQVIEGSVTPEEDR